MWVFLEKFKLENIVSNLSYITKRFPFAVIISIINTIFLIIITTNNFEDNSFFNKSIFSMIVWFLFSVWITLIFEHIVWDNCKKIKPVFQSILYIIPSFLYIVVFYIYIKDINDYTFFTSFFLNIVWFISILFIWSFIYKLYKKDYIEKDYYNYFFEIASSITKSSIVWFLSMIFWFIAIWSISTLFFKIDDDSYPIWASISFSFITPLIFLSNIPKKDTKEKDFIENIFFSFIIKYLVIPFCYFYFIILYLYSIKVLINFWDWPKWEVSYMVIWFSILWYITYILSLGLAEKNILIKTFRNIFPYIVFPQIFMLFYAIYLRINQYDLTMNRYLVVVFWIYLIIISLYFIFSKIKNLVFIPIILTIFTLIISIWPWSIYNFPISRQYKRLINNLETAKIYNNWVITPLKSENDISKELSSEIYNGIEYVCDYDKCSKIKELFKKELEILDNNQTSINNNINKNYNLKNWSKWEITSAITEFLKVKHTYNDYKSDYIYYYTTEKLNEDISWYKYIEELNYNNNWNLTYKDNKIYYKKDELTEEIDISFIVDIVKSSGKNTTNKPLIKTDLTWKNIKIKLILKNISIDWDNITSLEWFWLIK